MMLTAAEIAELTALMRANGVESLDISEGGASIRLVAAPGEAAPPSSFALSPGVGHLIAERAPGEPFAAPGAVVQAGDILGLIAAGLVRRPVTAPGAGVLLRALLEPGALAGFGTPLFELSPYHNDPAQAGPEDA